MMNKDFSDLLRYFHDELYEDGVAALRRDLALASRAEPHPAAVRLRDTWQRLAAEIRARSLPSGGALSLVADDGNVALDDETEEGAYAWLDQLTRDVDGEA
jgi:hypothetical protein